MPDMTVEIEMKEYRDLLAQRYLRGEGIEIGALNAPLKIREGLTISRYVDCFSYEQLKEQYPELNFEEVVVPDIVDDGEYLQSINDESVDYVVANHLLEHTKNPIGTIGRHTQCLKPGGLLYYAVPDKRYSFDVDRPTTSVGHLIRDFLGQEDRSSYRHFLEWEILVNKTPESKLRDRVKHLEEIDYRIHFHVFDMNALLSLIRFVCDYVYPLEIEHLSRNHTELIVILRKYTDEWVQRFLKRQ